MRNPFSGFFRSRDKPQNAISAAPIFFRFQQFRQNLQPEECCADVHGLCLRPCHCGNYRLSC